MAPPEQPCLVPRSIYAAAAAHRLQPRPRFAAAAAMESSAGGSGLTNLVLGPLLQCMEAATLGMPFEARHAACSAAKTRF